MNPRQWAAWIGHRTGLHTYETFYSVAGAVVGFGTTVHFERGYEDGQYAGLRRTGSTLNYQRPAQIAERIARTWGKPGAIMSPGELMAAVMYLESEQDREWALKGADLLAKRDTPDGSSPLPVLAEISRLAEQMAIPGNPALKPMTEPREVFEAELALLTEREDGPRPDDLVDKFMDEVAS